MHGSSIPSDVRELSFFVQKLSVEKQNSTRRPHATITQRNNRPAASSNNPTDIVLHSFCASSSILINRCPIVKRGARVSNPALPPGSSIHAHRTHALREREREKKKIRDYELLAMDMDVVIVGGGLGGLALAVGLRERGIKAQVYERAAEHRHNTGTAISIGHNGITALEGIQPGLALDQMGEFGSYTRILSSILPGVTPGEKDIVTRRAIPPGRMLMIPWKEARDVLVQNLDPAMIHYRHTFVHYTPIQGGVEVYFDVKEEEKNMDDFTSVSKSREKVVCAKLLVGADGVWSQVRQIMIGDKPRDLKLVLWNAIVHNPDSALFKLHDKDELKFIGMGGKRVGFLMDVGNSILLRDGLGAEHTLWQLRAPDEDGELARTRKTDLEVYGQNALKMRVLKHVKGPELAFKAVEEAIEATDPQSIWERNLYDRLPLAKWTDPSGHVVLIGDAAHGMHPGPGEGARTTFEDAHQLSILLHNVFSTSDWNDKLHKALAQFEEVRIPRMRRIQAYAAELTGFRELIPDWVLELPLEEKLRRSREFSAWTQTYPKNITGDAASTYWKP